MNNEELVKRLKNDKEIKKIAAHFVRMKSMEDVAAKLDCSVETLEDIFIDHPDLDEKFNQEVYEYSRKLAYRKIRAGLDEAISKLNELITDPDEAPENAYRSANSLLSIWTKIDATKVPGGGKEEKDDLDDIWELIQDEAQGKKDSENSKGTKQDIRE